MKIIQLAHRTVDELLEEIFAITSKKKIDINDKLVLYALACAMKNRYENDVPKWISCSERLPEDYVDVLVWFEYFRYGDYNCMCATHGIGNYSKEYNSWTINHETGWKDLRVIAWMPLPEAYKPNK